MHSMSQTIPHHSSLWSLWCFYKATVATLKHRLSMPAVRKNLTIQKRKSITKITLALPEATDKVWKTGWETDDLSLHYADVCLCMGALIKAAHIPPPTHAPTKNDTQIKRLAFSLFSTDSGAPHLWLDGFEHRSIHERNLALEKTKHNSC